MGILLAPAVAFFTQHGHTIDVTVAGTKQPTVDEIALTFDGNPKHAVHPTTITSSLNDPMAIVFVMEGNELWIGNDDVEIDPNFQIQGVLHNFEAAFDRLDLVHRLPPGSDVGIVTYATGAKLRMPLSPVAQVHGSAFGVQQDYRNAKGADLVQGVALGIDEVSRASAPNKLVIVIYDETDSEIATAKRRMNEQLHRAATANISIDAVAYKGEDVVHEVLLPRSMNVNSVEGIQMEIASFIAEHRQSFHATFDISKLPVWDGKPHDAAVNVGGQATDPTSMTLGVYTASARWWTSVWFRIALAAAVIVLFGVVALRLLVARRTLKASA